MKVFEIPNVEVIKFAVEDIVTTSNTNPDLPEIVNIGLCIG